MGNNNGRGYEFGSIYVRTEKPYYFSGETVIGSIYLNITRLGFPAKDLILKIKGYEYCKWDEVRHEKIDEQNTRKVIDYHEGEKEFFKKIVPLYQVNAQFFPVGQYVFPFQFQLQANLPGSYEEIISGEEGQNYEAYVRYKVKGELESVLKDFKIKHTQIMIVREPLKELIQLQQQEKIINPKTWCCLDQGECKIKCYFDKNAYLPGEQSFLQINFDNSKCKLNVTQFVGKLERTLTLRSNNGKTRQFNHIMNSKQMPEQENDNLVLGGAKPVVIQMSFPLINAKNSKLNQELKPLTNGTIVNCNYQLSGEAVLDGCNCCSDKPEIIAPISIISPIPIVYNVVPQIQNWSPQVFPVQSVTWGNNPNLLQQPMIYQNPNTVNMNTGMQMNSYQPINQQY